MFAIEPAGPWMLTRWASLRFKREWIQQKYVLFARLNELFCAWRKFVEFDTLTHSMSNYRKAPENPAADAASPLYE
jgi:hypothetical protein